MVQATTLTAILLACLIYANGIPTPTPDQLAYEEMEIGAIIHFNMATAAGTQGCGQRDVPPLSTFNPKSLNTDQWAESMRAMGVKYAVYVAKHNCGFCTWHTTAKFPEFDFTYEYSVNNSAYKGDVVKQFIASMKKYDIRPGFYYSVVTNSYLNVHSGVVQGGTLAPGQVKVTQSQYNQIVLAQIAELWTNNGPLAEIWFDGGYTSGLRGNITALLDKLQPHATAFNGCGVSKNPVRWIGSETGHAPYPTWSTGTSGGGDPNSSVWVPAECDVTLQNYDTWFYNEKVGLRTLKDLMSIYHDSVGHNCNMLLDFAPTPDGVLPADAVKRYKEFGDYIKTCYGSSVGSTSGSANTLTITFSAAQTIDRVVLQENQKTGQIIRSYNVMANVSGKGWTKVASGTSVGNKNIALFSESVEAIQVRVDVTASLQNLTPNIRFFGAYKPCPAL